MNVSAPLMDKQECADLLHLSVRQLERLVHSREIRAVKIWKSVRFDRVDVHAFITHRKTKLAPLELKGHIASFQREHTSGGID